MKSKATTVKDYLAELPEERRKAISAVRAAINKHLPKGYEECMQYGMISWAVPLKIYPKGYLCDPTMPLPYAALASQKNYMAVYLMTVYGDGPTEAWFKKAYAATGKKLDMGKSCVRFRKLEDLAVEVIGEAVGRVPVEKYIAQCEATCGSRKKR